MVNNNRKTTIVIPLVSHIRTDIDLIITHFRGGTDIRSPCTTFNPLSTALPLVIVHQNFNTIIYDFLTDLGRSVLL
jgi:hypothetical protein